MNMVNSDPSKFNLSFSGCGFLCIYHAGVAAAIKEYAPQLTQHKISGASAGSIIAAGLLCDICISQATSTVLKVVSQARSRSLGPLHPAFNLLGIVREEIIRTMPADAYIRCTNRLQISLTRWRDMKNVVVTEYASNKELIDAIICSCFIPVYCGLVPPTYRGEEYIDGGFTDNQPAFDEHTVTVSPFSGESDICPPDWDSSSFFGIEFSHTSIRFTTRNLFRLTACLMPPTTEDCSKMCLQGFEDALRFLTKNSMAPCIRCLTIQTNVSNPPPSLVSPNSNTTLSPLAPSRTKSANQLTSNTSSRRRLESECETCCESEHVYNSQVSEVFPSIMKRTLAEAAAAEESIFKYLLSFRIIRYARTAMGISKLPIDMLVIFVKNVIGWLNAVVAPEWLTNKLKSIVSFVYAEIDHHRSKLSARYSCQLDITEMDYEVGGQSFFKETHGEIELSAEAQRELAALRAKDKRNKKPKSHVRPHIVPRNSDVSSSARSEGGHDSDSLSHVIEYTATHDAMYAFHYLDENNKVRNIELFNVMHGHNHRANSPRGKTGRIVGVVQEEHEKELSEEMETKSAGNPTEESLVLPDKAKEQFMESELSAVEDAVPSSSKKDENDSGLSVEESSAGKRDACCSPVRHFSQSASSHAQRGSRTSRSAHSKRPHSASQNVRKTANLTIRDYTHPSSDSDADSGEKFFVPRRHRAPLKEYDGEPEQSDTEPV